MKRLLFFLFAWIFAVQLIGQVVTTNPAFPIRNETVTITFNAKEGDGGLEGFTGDVYFHTGVITENSNSPSDWKYVKTTWGEANPAWRMTRIGSDLYQFTFNPSLELYFGVPSNEEILQMAFVFRNGDGSRTGRDIGGADIFIDVFENGNEFILKVDKPQTSSIIVEENETIEFRATTSKTADFELRKNGSLIHSESATTNFSFDYQITETGSGNFEIKASDGSETSSVEINYLVVVEPVIETLPPNAILGLDYINNSKIRLVLEAPNKDYVVVNGDFTNWKLDSDFFMKKTPDGKYFWIEIDGLVEGQMYSYAYIVNGNFVIADPLSEIVLDPYHDQFIDERVWPGLPEYPLGGETYRLSLFKMGGFNFDWQFTDDFEKPAIRDLVIYELLVRDFLADHSYLSLTDTLDYLQRLGVNVIELMPINEFDGNVNWGYSPSYHMALDKYYGHPDHLKTFIDEAHKRGIAVFVDVVFNHATNQSPLAEMYWDNTQNRPATNSPYLNAIARHPFNVYNDMNHESSSTRDYVDRTIRHWIENYRIDGFRFDLSKGLTQTFSSDVGQWGQYDQSRVDILEHYADVCWEADPEFIVTFEHLGGNSEEEVLQEYGIALWGNEHGPFKEASLGYNSGSQSDFSNGYYKNRGWTNPNLITYMNSHDEQRLMYENLNHGNSFDGYNIKNFKTSLKRLQLASAFMILIPGPKLWWQFDEMGYDYPINYCEDGSIKEECRTGPKPIRWDYKNDPDRSNLIDMTADLVKLKLEYGVSRNEITSSEFRKPLKFMSLTGSGPKTVVIGNFGVIDQSATVAFPGSGMYYDYVTGDSMMISSPIQEVTLLPGETRIWIDRRIPRPSGKYLSTPVTEIVEPELIDLRLWPNPLSNGVLNLEFRPGIADSAKIIISDNTGSIKYSTLLSETEIAEGKWKQKLDLTDGTYHLIFQLSEKQSSITFIQAGKH